MVKLHFKVLQLALPHMAQYMWDPNLGLLFCNMGKEPITTVVNLMHLASALNLGVVDSWMLGLCPMFFLGQIFTKWQQKNLTFSFWVLKCKFEKKIIKMKKLVWIYINIVLYHSLGKWWWMKILHGRINMMLARNLGQFYESLYLR